MFLLKIQDDEAVESYIARNRFVFGQGINGLRDFGELSKYYVDDLKRLASAMGWRGCYGFNTLLHNHTSYAKCSLIHIPGDESYSGDFYTSVFPITSYVKSKVNYICVECAISDLKYKGFTYWRRSHQFDVKFCAIHRRKLTEFCCSCAHLYLLAHRYELRTVLCDCNMVAADYEADAKAAAFDLKVAILHKDVYLFGYQIPSANVYVALDKKLKDMGRKSKNWLDFSAQSSGVESLYNMFIVDMEWWSIGSEAMISSGIPLFCFISILYSSFQDFLNSVDCQFKDLIPVCSKWSTHKIRGGFDRDSILEINS